MEPPQMSGQQQPDYNISNPFSGTEGQAPTAPDVPMEDPGTQMLKTLLDDERVPEPVKEEYWYVFSRDNVLTFLDAERKQNKLLNFDILKTDKLNSTPWYNYTFEEEHKWNAVRQIYDVKLDRALGKGDKNERLAIPMTITENISRSEDVQSDRSSSHDNFIKRILNRS